MLIWFRTFQLGIKSLLLHPLRSMLTVLGIFIGVASVIWLMAIGEGISRKAQEQIESLGADNIIVRSIKPASPVMKTISRHEVPAYGIERVDYELVLSTIPTVVESMPVREMKRKFAAGPKEFEGRLVGTTPNYRDMNHLEMDRGHFFTDAEMKDSSTPSCILSWGMAERLFPSEDPLGKTVRIQGNQRNDTGFPYRVIGVTKPRSATSAIGGSFAAQDFTYDVYVPITTLWARMWDLSVVSKRGSFEAELVELNQITLKVDKLENVMETADIIKDTLAKRHTKQEDFAVTVPLELLEQARTTRIMFNVFMGLIAAISLLVGGIGIMNIMLATVTERTREIGIRRALGAKRRDIIRQFLVETVVLSVVGGGIGILVGLLCRPVTMLAMWAIKNRMPRMIEALPEIVQEIQPIIVPISIPLAFGISVVIGVVFGIYPAIRAATMDPIEALRHE